MQTIMKPKFNLSSPDGHANLKRFFEECISESMAAWTDVKALSDLSFEEYFDLNIHDDQLHNGSEPDTDLLVEEDQMEQASAIFSEAMLRTWIDWLVEFADGEEDEEGSLHVVCIRDAWHGWYETEKIEAVFSRNQEEFAQHLVEALEEDGNGDYEYNILARKGAGLVDYYE